MRLLLRKVNYNVLIIWISFFGIENYEGSILFLGEILKDNYEFN